MKSAASSMSVRRARPVAGGGELFLPGAVQRLAVARARELIRTHRDHVERGSDRAGAHRRSADFPGGKGRHLPHAPAGPQRRSVRSMARRVVRTLAAASATGTPPPLEISGGRYNSRCPAASGDDAISAPVNRGFCVSLSCSCTAVFRFIHCRSSVRANRSGRGCVFSRAAGGDAIVIVLFRGLPHLVFPQATCGDPVLTPKEALWL